MRTFTLTAFALFATACNPSFPEGVIVLGDDTGCNDCVEDDTADSADADADTDTDSDTDADTDSDTDTDTAIDTGDTAEDTATDTGSTDPYASYIRIDGSQICFSTDGFNFPYNEAAAYVVGYGEGLDFTLKASHAVSPVDGDDCVETSDWEYDTFTVTLISSLQSDGSLTTTYANTGDWWDNFDFCTSGFPTALAYCTEMEDGNFLVSVAKTTEGLVPAGSIVE